MEYPHSVTGNSVRVAMGALSTLLLLVGIAFCGEAAEAARMVHGLDTQQGLSVQYKATPGRFMGYPRLGISFLLDERNAAYSFGVTAGESTKNSSTATRTDVGEVAPGVGAFGLLIGDDIGKLRSQKWFIPGGLVETGGAMTYVGRVHGAKIIVLLQRGGRINGIMGFYEFHTMQGVGSGSSEDDIIRAYGPPGISWITRSAPRPHRKVEMLAILLFIGVASGMLVKLAGRRLSGRRHWQMLLLFAGVGAVVGVAVASWCGTLVAGVLQVYFISVPRYRVEIFSVFGLSSGIAWLVALRSVMTGRTGLVAPVLTIISGAVSAAVLFVAWPRDPRVLWEELLPPLMAMALYFLAMGISLFSRRTVGESRQS